MAKTTLLPRRRPPNQGLTFDENALLEDKQLRPHIRPISATMMDWMHNYLVNGVANFELHLWLGKAKSEVGVRYATLQEFVQAAWQWPHSQATHKVALAHKRHRVHSLALRVSTPAHAHTGALA